jgi:tetratricopeptide (TPR) repeat protein
MRRPRRMRSSERARSSGETATAASPDGETRKTPQLVLLGAVFVALLVCAITVSVVVADRLAIRAAAARDPDAALAWLTFAERFHGVGSQGELLRARLARRKGNVEQMARHLQAAEQAGASKAAVRREWMLAEIQSGRLESHEPQVKAWLMDGDPDLAEIADAYANGLAACSRFDEALEILGAWGNDYPKDPMPAFRAGRIQEFFEDFETAAGAYQEAVNRRDDFLPGHFALGRVLLRQKKPNEALREFAACLDGPTALAAEVATAECLAELGQTDAAMQRLEMVLLHDESDIHASYLPLMAPQSCFVAARLLGTLETNAGSHQRGLEFLDRALRYNPRDVAARYSRAVALRGLGNTAEAEAELADIEENRAAMKQVNTLRNKINRDPNDVTSRIELGMLLAEHESIENGLFWLRSALERDPQNQLAQQQIDGTSAEEKPHPSGSGSP